MREGLIETFDQQSLGWYNLAHVWIGRTDAVEKKFSLHAELQQPTTFFTDASSITPATFGRPYLSVKRTITGNANNLVTVILPLLPTDIAFESIPATPLCEGYSSSDALKNAFRTKIMYQDTMSMTEVTFDIAEELHFSTGDLKFYAADGKTLIEAPATLRQGDVIYVAIPLKEGKPIDSYSGVLRINGIWQNAPTGYIRQITDQEVIYCDPTPLKCEDCGNCPSEFSPLPGKDYVLSGWVKDATAMQQGAYTYGNNCSVVLAFTLANTQIADLPPMYPSGAIIDGWQQIQGVFTVPADACKINLKLNNHGSNEVFFDDIRVHPFNASMKSFVYDPQTLRLAAELDDNNYATFYEYDEEGALIRVKKETEKGVMTIREARQGQQKTTAP